MDDDDEDIMRFVDHVKIADPQAQIDVIKYPDRLFELAKSKFPPLLGVIDWNKANREFTQRIESLQECKRIFVERFVRYAAMSPASRCIVLSDDYYELGVHLSCSLVPLLLTEWFSLPHAIFVFSEDMNFVFHISFIREVSYGKSRAHT